MVLHIHWIVFMRTWCQQCCMKLVPDLSTMIAMVIHGTTRTSTSAASHSHVVIHANCAHVNHTTFSRGHAFQSNCRLVVYMTFPARLSRPSQWNNELHRWYTRHVLNTFCVLHVTWTLKLTLALFLGHGSCSERSGMGNGWNLLSEWKPQKSSASDPLFDFSIWLIMFDIDDASLDLQMAGCWRRRPSQPYMPIVNLHVTSRLKTFGGPPSLSRCWSSASCFLLLHDITLLYLGLAAEEWMYIPSRIAVKMATKFIGRTTLCL